MSITTIKVEVKTIDLTKNIVKQLDELRTANLTVDNVKDDCRPVGRVETGDDFLVIFETLRGAEKLKQIYWNDKFTEAFGRLDKLPKIILLK